jgi:hypothetical protein
MWAVKTKLASAISDHALRVIFRQYATRPTVKKPKVEANNQR